MNWNKPAQDMMQRRDSVNTVMNFLFTEKHCTFLLMESILLCINNHIRYRLFHLTQYFIVPLKCYMFQLKMIINRLKVKSSQNRPRRPRQGVEVQLYSFFNPSTRWGWVVNAMPRPLCPWERPGTHCIGGWVGPRASLDGCGKCRPHRHSIPRQSSPQQVATLTELSRPVSIGILLQDLEHQSKVLLRDFSSITMYMLQ